MDEEDAEIILGTYEDYVVGYQIESTQGAPKKRLKSKDNDDVADGSGGRKKDRQQYLIEQSFAVRAHSGSVRCLAASQNGTLAVSIGFDEAINLFSLKKRKLLQTIEGPINCVSFVGNTHIICGAEDNNIYIYEYKSSEISLAKTLRGHKGPVTALSVHPSGKVLLTLSKDNTMKTWNLIKGRSAYTNQIKPQAHLITWSKSGNEFLIAANNEVYLYNNNSGTLEHSIKLDKRINSVEFITDKVFVIASDSGKLEFFDLKKGVSLMKFEAHETRIKSVKCLNDGSLSASSNLFVTASSDGLVKLWTIGKPGAEKPQELSSVDIGARLTCMTSIVHANS